MVGLISEMKSRNFTFIIGSGASVSSGIPKGEEIAYQWLTYLIKMIPAPPDNSYLKKLYDEINNKGVESIKPETVSRLFNQDQMLKISRSPKPPYFDWMIAAKILYKGINESYFEIASYLANNRSDLLLKVLYEAMQGKQASSGYNLLAIIMQTSMQFTKHNIVITTNFDDLILQAIYRNYNYNSLSPVVISHSSLANQLELVDISKQPILYKVHNDLFFNPKNTTYEVTFYSSEVKKALTTLIKGRRLLVIGYSGASDGLMTHLIHFEEPLEIYWAYYDKEPETEQYLELRDRSSHTVKAFRAGDFDEFMKSLVIGLLKNGREVKTMDDPISDTSRISAREQAGLEKFKIVFEEESIYGKRY